jgi:alpha-L-rhamnosidase
MKYFYEIRQPLALAVIVLACIACSKQQSIQDLRVESRKEPIGIDVQQPRFSWQIVSDSRNVSQTAYQIMVADSPDKLNEGKDLVWNSGKTESSNSVLIPYAGPPLVSRATYYWKVKVWTGDGSRITSEQGKWGMALLSAEDWKASWIGIDSMMNEGEKIIDTVKTRLAARYLRKEFPLDNEIKTARIYVSGLGLYECYINGEKISHDIFAPTATDYSKHVNYNVYEVGNLLKGKTRNTICVILGNGRFVSMRMALDARWGVPPIRNYGFPKLLLQLEVEYKNGERAVIVSDTSWKINTHGPVIANNEYDGEEYNANLEFKGWMQNGYNDKEWLMARIVSAPEGKLVAQRNPNIVTMQKIHPVSIKEVEKGKYILDMGQNMVGWLAVHLQGKKNRPIVMRFAENLKSDGNLYLDNIRGAMVTNVYTPASYWMFNWEPRFTYQGFRFVEITGIDYMPKPSDFTGKVNYDEMENTGSFACSDSTLNQIYKNAWWGIRGNYRSIPTDCPQRDERMGWLGDRATGCFGESFMFGNALLYDKWLQDIHDAQRDGGIIPDVTPAYWDICTDNVTWPCAYIHVANMLYEQYGDARPIQNHYESMRSWVLHIRDAYLKDDIIIRDQFGDWCMPPESPELINSKDPARITPGPILATTFYYRVLELMAKFAVIANHTEDVQQYTQLSERIKIAFNNAYLDRSKGQYGNNTVTGNMISLMTGMAPDEDKEKIFRSIVEKTESEFRSHVSVGLIGIQYLMRGLTEYGRGDLAYRIATNTTYPSWGYMAKNNATTIWELWNGNTANPAMNSGNHVMLLGDLLIWYYENLAGIRTDKKDVGFKKIIMKPFFPAELSYVKASHRSPYGEIRSEWKKDASRISWKISIPPNSSALISLPALSTDQVTEGGQKVELSEGIKLLGIKDGYVNLEVGSGNYQFKVDKTEK